MDPLLNGLLPLLEIFVNTKAQASLLLEKKRRLVHALAHSMNEALGNVGKTVSTPIPLRRIQSIRGSRCRSLINEYRWWPG